MYLLFGTFGGDGIVRRFILMFENLQHPKNCSDSEFKPVEGINIKKCTSYARLVEIGPVITQIWFQW